ncbi:MAG TPA: hypothetical protein VL754_10300 [Verrucomicrobiae bacterium]|jgi:hypothetical protein|nr:hypothetical protein [Verrucomicrobiae bacterium]
MPRALKIGDRVRVSGVHRWVPDRCGTVKQVKARIGNRFVVRFDSDEFGLWHDDDGDPVLSLGEKDLVLIDDA